MSGRDVVVLAETGSGKTMSYLLPLLMFLKNKPKTQPGGSPIALILAPTRELVEQVYSIIDKLISLEKNYHFQITSLPTKFPTALGVVGGISLQSQIIPLQRNGIDILIATPGRLIDLLEKQIITMEALQYLVIDEADKMITLNMEEQVRKILGYASICVRQSLLLSATMPNSLERLARSAVLNPITIKVGQLGAIPTNITQNVIFVNTYQKREKLLQILRKIERPPVIIFCNYYTTVDKLVLFLRNEQFHVAGIHSNKTQQYRFRVMKAFKEQQLDILISSDLISRGIDIIDCQHVILYDIPNTTIEDYIHRTGRTGRIGKVGTSTSFLTFDCKIAKELKELLKQTNQKIPKELEDTKVFGHDILKSEFGDIPSSLKYGLP